MSWEDSLRGLSKRGHRPFDVVVLSDGPVCSCLASHLAMLAPRPGPGWLLDPFVGIYKIARMVERLRGLMRGVGPRGIQIGAAILLSMILLSVLFFIIGVRVGRQETAEQAKSEGETTSMVSESDPEDYPLLFGAGPSSSSPAVAAEPARAASATKDEEGSEGERGISGLSDMDVIGELQYVPDTDFRCPGISPSGGGLYQRTCTSRTAASPAVYQVTLVEDDPSAVYSVTATARDASDEEAAEVLGYVARLSIGAAGPLDAAAWVERSIYAGGQYFSNGAEIRVYGAEGARTLEILAAPMPAEEHGSKTAAGTPETTNGSPR